MIINISWSKDLAHNFISEQVDFKDLWQLTHSDFNYTAGSFLNGHRTANNWEGGNNCLIFDIDSNLSISEASEIILSMNLKALIVTTKSHQKEKNGIICDRYRAILPLQRVFYGSIEKYKEHFTEATKIFKDSVDMTTKDPSRFYYGNKNQQYWYIEGDTILDWSAFQKIKKQNNVNNKKFFNITDSKKIQKWFIENTKEGSRNKMLYRAGMYAKDASLDYSKFINTINNNIKKPLEDKELKQIIKSVES